MKKIFKTNKHRLFGIVILIITIFIYKSVDVIIFAKNSAEKKIEVYTREITEIPVMRSNLNPDKLDKTIEPVDQPATQSGIATNFDIKNLSSKSVYIEDLDTNTKLFEKNSERLLLPASATKLMTALIAAQVYEIDDVLTVPNVVEIEGSSVGLFKGEKMTAGELLKAALIQSSNDAAYALATNYSGGIDEYVKLMNQKAIELNLKSTFFENPAGFDGDGQRSSAHDLAIISKEFMKNDFLKLVVSKKEETIGDVTGVYKHRLFNTHQLLWTDNSVVGIKTGTTEGAHQVLITQFNRDGRNILIIVMGSDDRYQETSQLIEWVFREFVWLTPEQIIEKS